MHGGSCLTPSGILHGCVVLLGSFTSLCPRNSITVKIPVETKQGLYSLPASWIIAVEALGRKIIVHTTCQDFESIHNINYWLEVLPQNSFFQTHRSFIVNFEHVVDFDHTTIHLSDQQIIAYLTRRKYTAFKNAYLLYLESMR